MIVLGIETSCDETAAAVVKSDGTILSNLVLSQIKEHQAFGGVVPEIAARAHVEHLHTLIKAAIADANLTFDDLDAVAATCGPGLIGGVLVGALAGKSIAMAKNIPFMAINHLEGHALTPRLTDKIEFPYLLLLISGGHTQILIAEDVGTYKRWGTTLDDAAGECFDKSAKLMGLPYPGGPNLEKIALQCKNPEAAIKRFPLPHPLKDRKTLDFSFSGLKTAMRNHVEALPEGDLNPADIADLAHAFQHKVSEIFADRLTRAIEKFKSKYPNAPTQIVLSGGVAANQYIANYLKNALSTENPSEPKSQTVNSTTEPREAIPKELFASKKEASKHETRIMLYNPPLDLSGDNAAMIAWAGIEHLKIGSQDGQSTKARPRWPLDPTAETQ